MWQQLKQLGQHSAIYGLGNIASSIMSFLLVPLYTHSLTPAEFGVYSLLITAYSLLGVVVDFGLTNSLARYYFNENPDITPEALAHDRQTLVSTAVVMSSGLAFITGVALFCLAPWIANDLLNRAEQAPFVRLLAATLVFRGITTAPLIYLRVTERPMVFTILTSGQLLIFLALNIVLLTHFHLGVGGILTSLLISTAFYALGLLVSIAPDLKPRVGREIGRELLVFGLPFLPVLVMMWVIDLSDRYLLERFTTMTEVGIYSLGYKFGQCMTFVVTAFTLAWAPLRFKMLKLADPQTLYGRIATFYLAGAGCVWLVLALTADGIIAVTSPPEFTKASIFIAPVAMAYLIYGLFVLAVTGLGVAKNATSLPLIAVAAAVLNIGLNIFFIPRFGAIASAYATIAAYIALTLGSLWASHRLYPIHYEYRKMALIFAAMLVLGIGGAQLETWLNWPLWAMIPLKLLIFALYFVAVFASGLLSGDEAGKVLNLTARFAPAPFKGRLTRAAARKVTNEVTHL